MRGTSLPAAQLIVISIERFSGVCGQHDKVDPSMNYELQTSNDKVHYDYVKSYVLIFLSLNVLFFVRHIIIVNAYIFIKEKEMI